MEDSEISCHFCHFWVTVPVVSTKAGYRRSTSAYKTFCRRLFSFASRLPRSGFALRPRALPPIAQLAAVHWESYGNPSTALQSDFCQFTYLYSEIREREHKKGISFNHGWISALRSVTFIKPSNFFDMFIVVARSSYHLISYSISCWRLSRFLAYFLNLGVMLLMGQW